MAAYDHPLLAGQGKGIVKDLNSSICIRVFFLEGGASQWSEKQRIAFSALLMKTLTGLVHLTPGIKVYNAQETVSLPGSPVGDPAAQVLSVLGQRSIPLLAENRRKLASKRYGIDFAAAPLLFVVNTSGKSFTVSQRKQTDRPDEYSVLYMQEPGFSSRSITRAILQQMGAVDYTTDAELSALARRSFGDGIMLSTGDRLDPLNRYILGLSDLSPSAVRFLEDAAALKKPQKHVVGRDKSGSLSAGNTGKAAGSTKSAAGAKSAGGTNTAKAAAASKSASDPRSSRARHYRHVYLSGKDAGSTLRLKGEVHILHFLCDHGTTKWNEAARAEYRLAAEEAKEQFLAQAKKRSVSLSITNDYFSIRLEGDPSQDILQRALTAIRGSSIPELKRYYSLFFSCDETPVVLAMNEVYRSFARKADDVSPGCQEFSVIYRDRIRNNPAGAFQGKTIVHELCHQFGAPDYYYPAEVESQARSILPRSIMNDGEVIDDLTAYLIGWENSLSEPALRFLDATDFMTVEKSRQARIKENEKTRTVYGK